MDCQKILVYGLIVLVSIYLLKDVCGVKLPFIEGFDNPVGENSAGNVPVAANSMANSNAPSNSNANSQGSVANSITDGLNSLASGLIGGGNGNGNGNGFPVGNANVGNANVGAPSDLAGPQQVVASEPNGNEVNLPVQGIESVEAPCYPQNRLSPQDLLPTEDAGQIEQLNQQMQNSGEGYLAGVNFLDAGFNMGINTVGQSLRNANLNLRAEPPNPRTMVSPWMNSTIDIDLQRRPLGDTNCGPSGPDGLDP